MDIHGFPWTSMDIHGYPRICIFAVMIQIIEIRVRRGKVWRFKTATRAVQPKNVMNEGPEEGPASVKKSPTQTLKKTIPTQTHQTILFGLVWQTCLWEPSKIGSAGRSGVSSILKFASVASGALDAIRAFVSAWLLETPQLSSKPAPGPQLPRNSRSSLARSEKCHASLPRGRRWLEMAARACP